MKITSSAAYDCPSLPGTDAHGGFVGPRRSFVSFTRLVAARKSQIGDAPKLRQKPATWQGAP